MINSHQINYTGTMGYALSSQAGASSNSNATSEPLELFVSSNGTLIALDRPHSLGSLMGDNTTCSYIF